MGKRVQLYLIFITLNIICVIIYILSQNSDIIDLESPEEITEDANVKLSGKHNFSNKFLGWEFWDQQYKTPPAMLSKKSCGKICSFNQGLYNLLPDNYPINRNLFGSRKTCALVSSSKILDHYEFGADIDTHDIVLRFNLHKIRNPLKEGKKNNTYVNTLWILESI